MFSVCILQLYLQDDEHNRYCIDTMLLLLVLCTDVEQVTSDVLGLMMVARDAETGQGMSDEELRDQVVNLMIAGYEVNMSVITNQHLLLIKFSMSHCCVFVSDIATSVETLALLLNVDHQAHLLNVY